MLSRRSLLTHALALPCLVGSARAETIRFPSEVADLQAAVNMAQDGDVVLIEVGGYVGIGATVPDRAITIRGEGELGQVQILLGGFVTTPPPASGFTTLLFQGNGPETVLENIEFGLLIFSGAPGSAITTVDAGPTIRGCRFMQTISTPIATYRTNPSTPPVILDECQFLLASPNAVLAAHDTIVRNSTFGGGGDLLLLTGRHTVANCTFQNASPYAIQVSAGASLNLINALITESVEAAILTAGETNVYHSTIINNGSLEGGSFFDGGGIRTLGFAFGPYVVANSVIALNSPFDVCPDPNGAALEEWIILGSHIGSFCDPFSSLGVSGYAPELGRLLPGAPEIDAGEDDLIPPDLADLDNDADTQEPLPVDINGFPRRVGLSVDQGAFEGAWFEWIAGAGLFEEDSNWDPRAPGISDGPLFEGPGAASLTFSTPTATLPFLLRENANVLLDLSGNSYWADGIGDATFDADIDSPPTRPSIIEPGATLTIENGTLTTHALDLSGTLSIGPTATFAIPDLTVLGRLQGRGTLSADLITNLGTIAADATDPLGLDSNVRQSLVTQSGRIDITAPASSASAVPALDVAGALALDGTLVVRAPIGFDLPPGASVPLITSESISGRFDVALLPALPDRFLSIVYPSAQRKRANADRSTTISLIANPLEDDLVFNPAPSTETGNAEPSSATLADLNADGFIDLLLTLPDPNDPESAPGSVLVFYNDGNAGDGSWIGFANVSVVQQIFVGIGVFPSALDVADLNDDDVPDLIVTNRGPSGEFPPETAPDSVTVLINDATPPGVFEVSQVAVLPAGNRPVDVFAEDLDDDGLPDIAVLNEGSESVFVYWNEGPAKGAGAGRATPWITPDPVDTDMLELPEGSCPLSIEPGDFDASIHIVAANSGTDSVSVVINAGARNLVVAQNVIPVGDEPVRVLVIDIDLDGSNDILTIDRAGATVSIVSDLSIIGGIDPRVAFAPVTQFPVGASTPRSIAAGDFDDDGDLDLAIVATATQGQGVVKILRNDLFDAQLTLTPAPDQPAASPLFVLAGDVNDDGRTDLVTVNASTSTRGQDPSGEVRTLLAFAPPACAGDLDDDGDTDVADYLLFRDAFGTEPDPGTGADLDADGRVTVFDLSLFIVDLGCGQ